MNLQDARIQNGIQLQELANKARLSRQTIYNAEDVNVGVTLLNANRIIRALNQLAGTNYTVQELGITIKP